MAQRRSPVLLMFALLASLCACSTTPHPTEVDLRQQVRETERAFARTMARRDHAAFVAFLSSEAVFFNGDQPVRGRAQVAALWKRFYEGSEPPFSWEPDKVEVLDSGTLALSSGPVRDKGGKLIATFTSIWRLETPGVWHIVFDKGNEVCDPPR